MEGVRLPCQLAINLRTLPSSSDVAEFEVHAHRQAQMLSLSFVIFWNTPHYLWKHTYGLWCKVVIKFLIHFQENQAGEIGFLWRPKWQVISLVLFFLWIFIIRRPDKNLILIFSLLRYAQTFSQRWLNNLQSAFKQWGCNLGNWKRNLARETIFFFIRRRTKWLCGSVSACTHFSLPLLTDFMYVSCGSFDQLSCHRHVAAVGRVNNT